VLKQRENGRMIDVEAKVLYGEEREVKELLEESTS
jgi:hypothetical protein